MQLNPVTNPTEDTLIFGIDHPRWEHPLGREMFAPPTKVNFDESTNSLWVLQNGASTARPGGVLLTADPSHKR